MATLLVIFGYLVALVCAETYYIVPTINNISCSTLTTHMRKASFLASPTGQTPMKEKRTCLTLTEFIQFWSLQPVPPASDTIITLNFIPGNHTLHSRFKIQNVLNLDLKVLRGTPSSRSVAMVTCTNSTGFHFEHISKISVNDLVFNDCRENFLRSVDKLRVEDCKFQNGHGMVLRNVVNATFKRNSFISLTAFIREDYYLIVTPHESSYYLMRLSGGGIAAFSSNVLVSKCQFKQNIADEGGAIMTKSSNISIHNSYFSNNIANHNGGAIRTARSSSSIHDSHFNDNTAGDGGASLMTDNGNIFIHGSNFTNSTAAFGAVYIYSGNISIHDSHFTDNKGGAISMISGNTSIHGSHFSNNIVTVDISEDEAYGGAIWAGSGSISIHDSHFSNNTADYGGAVYFGGPRRGGNVIFSNSIFNNNHATYQGGAIFTESRNVTFTSYTQITNNSAMVGAVFTLQSTLLLSGDTTISDNKASFYAFASNVTFAGHTIFTNNVHENDSSVEEGGAVTSFQSEIILAGTVKLTYNRIQQGKGGAILSSESKIYSYGDTTIANNTALSGGGIYVYQSEFTSNATTNIIGNIATLKGGGIYVVGSTVKLIGGWLQLNGNRAERGGGVSMELNGKLYVIKAKAEYYSKFLSPQLKFTNNSAEFGGAIYVSDDTNTGTCTSNTKQLTSSECFFQDLSLHSLSTGLLNVRDLFFTGNTANISGGTIYGGLLDRCAISPYAQVFKKYPSENVTTMNAIHYLTNTSDIQASNIKSEISSQPVRVCFCGQNNQPDCNLPPPTYSVKKGETFKVVLVAVDQVRNPIPSYVRALLSSNLGGLSEGQDTQDTSSECTELNFTITSPQDSEQLVLYADGPCNDLGISQTHVNVPFLPCDCPIGFVASAHQSNCSCECDPCLYPNYTSDCSLSKTWSSVQRRDNIWISYINESDLELTEEYPIECPYLIYLHCPFDYCHPSTSVDPVWINLNTINGSDAQCAFNRSGKLCGSCKDGFSLALGSSRCMQCSNKWLALLIVFAIAGIALVAFLLIFNLTVAVGTINGLLFYANILTINRATFFPFDTPVSRFFTVFIAWINLDFGFVTCFFDRMDGYAKQWLQLAFPIYIILMVTMVIIGCEYSTKFARLFTGTNPVATLATLILLSYTKSVRLVIAALSSATLEYPDGSQEKVWLIDANVLYLKGKHIPLFLVALLILFIGIVYTSLLFSYQWLLRCPNRRALKWIKNVRFYPFMDAYLAPYNNKHRYWTGLLLLIRAFLFVVSAFNVSGDPGNNLLLIILTLTCLLLLKTLLPGRIYKSWPLDTLETSFIFNLIVFSVGSLYIKEAGIGNQVALAYTSTSIAFITFLAILVYHVYAFVLPKKVVKKLNSFKSSCLFFKEENHVPEIILFPNPVCTYSVVDGIPHKHKLLDESVAAAKHQNQDGVNVNSDSATKKELSVPADLFVAGQQTTDETSNVSEQTANSNKTIKDKKGENSNGGQQKGTVNIELETRPSKFTDYHLDAYIRDSDEVGMERETEISDFIEVAQCD